MQELPSPPAYECVKADPSLIGNSYLVVAGDPIQVSALIAEARAYPRWIVEADTVASEVRFIRLRAPLSIPYRDVGGLIYRAQQRHLSVSFTTKPLICAPEED